jgi:hypothetical protein
MGRVEQGFKLDFSKVELTPNEARFLVDSYYNIQELRKATGNQIFSMNKLGEPTTAIEILFNDYKQQEDSIKKVLDRHTDTMDIGKRMKDICGIGPVITAGILAHIDIKKAPTAGHIWSFAGLNPEAEWKKGEKRPWNADLKTLLVFKLGESFVKVKGNKNDFYGQYYDKWKAEEITKNENGEFKQQAESKLAKYNIGKSTDAYKAYSQGKLPPAHIHARVRRRVVKLFISHLHQCWYQLEFGKPAPAPYVFAKAGHVHFIEPPESFRA